MKAWNRNVYYAMKYSIVGILLAAVVYSAI
jgi:hypothetical protein